MRFGRNGPAEGGVECCEGANEQEASGVVRSGERPMRNATSRVMPATIWNISGTVGQPEGATVMTNRWPPQDSKEALVFRMDLNVLKT